MHKWLPEHRELVCTHLPGKLQKEVLVMLNEKFNLDIKPNQLRAFVKNNKLTSGVNTEFKSGHVPSNKGKKGLSIGGVHTQFKKGHKPKNYKPVGHERTDHEGYTWIKVSDYGTYQERWKMKHKYLWEQENGPVPKGYKLLFADQDRSNMSFDNLILVSQKQLQMLNKKKLLTKNPELNKSSIILADLYSKIIERN